MSKVSIIIDNIEIEAKKDMTILRAALENNIYIPHICDNPDLKPAGVCRLCMVEIEGKGNTISCRTQVEQGMKIKTNTPRIEMIRRGAVKLLMCNHPVNCLTCRSNNNCELQKIAAYMGIGQDELNQLRRPQHKPKIDASNPFFDYDPYKCVLCGICVRTCDELLHINAIDYANRGYNTIISNFGNKPWVESICVSCGECVTRCPVGALSVKESLQPSHEIKTTCAYCGVGCGLRLGIRGNKVVKVIGDKETPPNKGLLCVKGRYGYNFINHSERLTVPLIKKKGEFVEATWDEALKLIADKFSQNKKNKFASLSSAKCTNEENYLMQKFTRSVMHTNNVDHCARLCHAPTVAGLVQSFGSGAMTNSINEISNVKTIFAIGTNTTSAHPVIALKMKQAVKTGGKLIVANPKRIDLCRYAELFLQHKPGTDVALMMGMAKVIIDEKLQDKEFINERCENFNEFKKSLTSYTLDFVEKTTGVPKEKIMLAARIYASNKPSAIFYSMGITQHTHGTDNVLATSNLALLTGNVGKKSTGVNPLRGQNNVQGACDLGALPNVYPGYQKVNIPEINKKFENIWKNKLDKEAGLTHLEIFDAIDEGKIKVLYIMGENPILSEANSSHVESALKKLDFFVAQDIFLTETAQFADVVLPGASFAEKDGTFTNTERRVQRVRKAIEPIGDSKPDWQIICEIAKKMKAKGFNFKDPSQIMNEIASVSPIYHGISYERIDKTGLQWPCRSNDDPGTVFLHSEKFAGPSGKGNFKPLEYKPPAENPDKKYPLVLTTDRSLFHFHTASMTRRVKGLEELNSRELLNINQKDAAKLKLEDNDMVEVSSRRGKICVNIKITDICPPGVVSLTFHFAEAPTNRLTNSAMDPISKIPETKVCAVKVEKIKKTDKA